MQALIEADFRPVDIAFGEPNNCTARCGPHKLEKCTDCDVDFANMNRLSSILAANPNLVCPPPPQITNKNLSQMVNATKEEGNTYFRSKQHPQALMKYTQALKFAFQRVPWEQQQYMREECATVLSNRSAAFFEAGDYLGALGDAETVIQLKKPWSKGYFRKAKALVGLGEYQEAKEAIEQGLQFEPGNGVRVVRWYGGRAGSSLTRTAHRTSLEHTTTSTVP
ncbi:hypothetical protein OF83DRAFT_1059823 [Amylostereum chailletii]|nr:hypothetical protein OF83DRAFT_1059823 [Amylostereum chailletii]